ncbi:MAG TPA: spermidine/putrescine ABC transporter substrate-binding protein [Burkholderiales bacterium]|nr:spermidine/putrescine ABC transporter substrate-binding protein [Burkholderiales bacterium]
MKKLLCLLLLTIGLPALAKDDVLHVYNWNDYIAPETVDRFEKFCNCKVKQSYFSDNEELMAKLNAGAKGYDVMVPTSNYVAGMAKQGWLLPIDHAQVPNLKNILPQYLSTDFDPGNKYSVPYAMSITLIGYNDQKVKELGVPLGSWATIFDPKILEKIKGRVTVLDSQSELMAAALKYLGYSVNDRDPKHWQEAKDVILKAKPYWAAFNASSYIRELSAGNIWVVHGYSNDIYQADLGAQKDGKKFRIRHSLPKEGAVLALDAMVISKSAPRPDLAVKFINFMLEGQNSADLTNMIGSGNPNKEALKYIKPEIKQISSIFPDDETAKKLEMLKDLTPSQRRLMSRIWTEIKAK